MWRRTLQLAALLLAPGPACAAPPASSETADASTRTSKAKEPAVTRIHLIVGDQRLSATLDDTPAARDFASLLPLDLTLTDYARTEKVADLPRKLTTEGAPARYAASAGDITYYAPWGNLAIFYQDFRSASGLVRLGRLDGSVERLLGADAIRVRIEVAPSGSVDR